jgi:hypothetical protein
MTKPADVGFHVSLFEKKDGLKTLRRMNATVTGDADQEDSSLSSVTIVKFAMCIFGSGRRSLPQEAQ